ncbi:MAG TPA: hypothetical protein VIJ15_02780 [Dermatophilaceae bacterium]
MFAVALLGMSGTESAVAAGGCADAYVSCTVDGGGATVGMTSIVLDRAKRGLDLQTGKPDERIFEYTSATACQSSAPGGTTAGDMCVGAIQACAGNTPQQGQGPQIRLYRRELDAKGVPISTAWQLLGTTCFPQIVPGRPVLGMGQILAAFRNTGWAKPTTHIQPEGNVTLITLATYFEVKWPAEGFQPGEIDTVRLMGQQVRIRPTSHGFTYVFGDGTPALNTDSPGGTYPTGDVTHVYANAGIYSSHIDITYGGEFSVDGGPWVPIPDTVSVAGQLQPLTVRTAHARLVIK